MKIDISSIQGAKGASLDFSVTNNRIPLVFPAAVKKYVEPVHVVGQVTNAGKFFLVQGQIQTKLATVCDRCLEPFEYPVVLDFEVEFGQKNQVTEMVLQEKELGSLDDIIYPYEGTVIDLSRSVEDELGVGLPVKILCSQGCKGLCSSCGQNLNVGDCACTEESIDPRMEALRSLLPKTIE